MSAKIPITKEEIEEWRDSIQIGDRITIGHKEKDDDRGLGIEKRYTGRIIEKYEHIVLCEFFRHGHRFLETVRYVQLIQGDGA